MKRKCSFLLAAAAATAIFLSAAIPAQAQEAAHNYLTFSAGYFDIFDDDEALDLRFEYRPASSVFIDNLRPWAGMEATTDGTLWLGGGLLYDWNFSGDWFMTPSFGAGLYAQGDSDKDLDFPVQFRSQLEISYQYDSGIRAGAFLSHMSNASLSEDNPGVEVLGLSLSYPF